jgi:hypothetical protein
MSDRLPPALSGLLPPETGEEALRLELMREGAVNLGRLGRAVEAALLELRAIGTQGDPARRTAAVYACADAVWCYFVQREACGLRNHDLVVEYYAIPPEVLAKVGAPPPRAPG